MTRFLLTAAFGLALALPTLAQQPQRPRENDEVAKLRAEVRELEERLKQSAPKKEERKIEVRVEAKGDKKPDVKKDEPKGPPMGGGFTGGGFGGPPIGGRFSPWGSGLPNPGGGIADQPGQPDRNRTDMLTRMPGFDRLTKEEQATLTKLVEKMRAPAPSAGSNGRGGSVEARLDRLEKAIADLANAMRNQSGPGATGRGGPGGGR